MNLTGSSCPPSHAEKERKEDKTLNIIVEVVHDLAWIARDKN